MSLQRFTTAACCLLLSLFSTAALSQEALRWDASELTVGMGSGVQSGGALVVSADDSDTAVVMVPLDNLVFEQYSRIEVHFAGSRPLTGMVLLWRRSGEKAVREFELPVESINPLVVSMEDVSQWQGEAEMLGLGLYLPAGKSASLQSITMTNTTIGTAVGDALASWTHFASWRLPDINRYVGTRRFDQGIAPVPVFALALAVALVAVLLLCRLRGRSAAASWRAGGLVLLLSWISLDALWQWRLLQQVGVTAEQFGGKTNAEKWEASEDRNYVRLARMVSESIGDDQGARVFLASKGDLPAMWTAYHIAPLNTYWHRNGPELPSARYLRPGDHVLLVRPTAVRYDHSNGRLVLPDGEVSVQPLAQDQLGLLLKVL